MSWYSRFGKWLMFNTYDFGFPAFPWPPIASNLWYFRWVLFNWFFELWLWNSIGVYPCWSIGITISFGTIFNNFLSATAPLQIFWRLWTPLRYVILTWSPTLLFNLKVPTFRLCYALQLSLKINIFFRFRIRVCWVTWIGVVCPGPALCSFSFWRPSFGIFCL